MSGINEGDFCLHERACASHRDPSVECDCDRAYFVQEFLDNRSAVTTANSQLYSYRAMKERVALSNAEVLSVSFENARLRVALEIAETWVFAGTLVRRHEVSERAQTDTLRIAELKSHEPYSRAIAAERAKEGG